MSLQDQSAAHDSDLQTLYEVAAEAGVPRERVPLVSRHFASVGGRGDISFLKWGQQDPEVAFLHGGGQNARTWDRVLLELGKPAVAIDLPGHGHSYWRSDHDYGPRENAVAIATLLDHIRSDGIALVGMSLGGLTAIRLAAIRPDLVSTLVLVDVTPGTPETVQAMTPSELRSVGLIARERNFTTLEAMVEAATAASPDRPQASLRRGVRHNARSEPDGTWTWRYDLQSTQAIPVPELWADMATLVIPILLIQGGASSFVPSSDVQRFRKVQPDARIVTVPGAGHAVQSYRPTTVARLIGDFLA